MTNSELTHYGEAKQEALETVRFGGQYVKLDSARVDSEMFPIAYALNSFPQSESLLDSHRAFRR